LVWWPSAVESVVMIPNFWSGRRVFITGHTGFKGSWLSLWLQSLGAQVTGFALSPPTDPSLFATAKIADGMDSIIDDVRNLFALKAAMRRAEPEIVFHMAAQPLVRYSYENPVETYTTNVIGTVNLLESVREVSSVRVAIVITTDKCYENREWLWGYREIDRLGGYDPYSNSKACAELAVAAYRSSYFNSDQVSKHGVILATVRAGNVIGGGDWAKDRLIPDIIAAFSRGEKVRIRYPNSIRPWQHVLEPLHGYMLLAEKCAENFGSFSGAWNFGPVDSDAKPVRWVVETLSSLWGQGASWELTQGEHPHEAGYLKLDISKSRGRLGWEPRLQLVQALKMIVDWNHRYFRGEDARKITLDQIREFQKLI